MTEHPNQFTTVEPSALARVFASLVADVSTDPRLVAVLLAQSALETGHWRMMRCFNFGNVKATDKWVDRGGGYTFFSQAPPHARAPVSETMSRAAAVRNMQLARPRPDAPDKLDMVIGDEQPNGRVCWFWARHPQTRFRAFATLQEGAEAWLSLLAGKYGPALVPAARGDVAGYCRELAALGPYFTEDVKRYTSVVEQLYRKYLPIAQQDIKPVNQDPEPVNQNPYATRPEDIAIHPAGWLRLSTGVEITSMPVADTGGRGPQFCRGSETARKWLEQRGMRIASDDSYRELHRKCGADGPGVHITPTTIYVDATTAKDMASQAWCTRHDNTVMEKLEAIGWNGTDPVDNAGKHIDQEGDIIGWERKDGDPEHRWIQPESPAHRDHQQLDYATLVHAERDAPDGATPEPDSGPATGPRPGPSSPGDPPDDVRAWQRYLLAYFRSRGQIALPLYGADGDHGTETVAWTTSWLALVEGQDDTSATGPLWLAGFAEAGLDPAQMSLGLRCLAWTGYQLGLGVREIPGARHDARIVAYSAQCRRGGRLLGVDANGSALWDGGRPLRLTTDEEHWCATTVSAALVSCLLPGETPPHGARVSVAELVADARRAGTLRPVSWIPTPGSLAIEGRSGQSPIVGGKGHVRRSVRVVGAEYFGVGGNEHNTFGTGWYGRGGEMRPDGHQLVGWIEVA